MPEINIFSRNKDKPVTQWQKDLVEFFYEYQFYHCKVDEDGELIMYDVNAYSVREFLYESQTRRTWTDLQTRYDMGER